LVQLVCPGCGTRKRVPDARLQDGPSCARSAAALMAAAATTLDDASFERLRRRYRIAGTRRFSMMAKIACRKPLVVAHGNRSPALHGTGGAAP
jgi:hypothetical protein